MRNPGLEAVRGLAALVVLLTHLPEIPGVRAGVGQAIMLLNWGTEAVVVFFLLSGTVIRISLDRTPRSAASFLWTRTVRLLPLYFVAVAFSVLVLYVHDNPPDAWTIIGNCLFLQSLPGYVCPCLASNLPLWSLAFEAFFYLAFALTIGRAQPFLIWIWATLALVAAAT